jgi:hypothetical protein
MPVHARMSANVWKATLVEIMPSDYEAIRAQLPVVKAAWAFLAPFYETGDLEQAWDALDPVLRRCWAQWWLSANRTEAEADGYDVEAVAELFVAKASGHPLWRHFARVLLRDFRAAFPLDPATWGIGVAPRVLAPDIELLYVHRHIPTEEIWQPRTTVEVVPVVMHLAHGTWYVMNLGYEHIPVPGWPPTLYL